MSLVYNKTPLLRQIFPGKNLPQFFLKHESLQPSGSFKSRGIGNLILKNAARIKNGGEKRPQVFASSGGNAGFAAATACQKLSLPCTVVVPTATKARMVQKIKSTGANVIINGNHWREADEYLKSSIMTLVDKNLVEPIYVHPFDDPDIWEGHSSMVDEMLETLTEQKIEFTRIKGIVCSVGGGGLYNGIIQGLERHNLASKIPIVGVETVGCHVFHTSLKLGRQVEFDNITSIATSLGTASISRKTFAYAQKYDTRSVIVNDSNIIETCLRYTHDYNMVVEPACGASLHMGYNIALLEKSLNLKLTPKDVILIIACGGSSNTVQDLEQILKIVKNKKEEAPAYHFSGNFNEDIVQPKP